MRLGTTQKIEKSDIPLPNKVDTPEERATLRGSTYVQSNSHKRIAVKTKEACVGCNACGDVCPKCAIRFKTDEEGFLYPSVDTELCVDCGLCAAVCPVSHADAVRAQNSQREPLAFAGVNKDLKVRFDSTSGGIFSALADAVFDAGGFVGGAIWNDDFSISQIVTDVRSDLPKLRSSKYAQSDATGFYTAVKAAVKSGRQVLVCGTPCQMVALRQFLGKPYQNLLIVDFICRGINSPKIFREYIKSFEARKGCKVVRVKQKSKELGWRRAATKFIFEDGFVAYDPIESSLYMQGFLVENMYSRPSCYECKFKGFPRMADITLGDCWGAVNSLGENLDNDLGTSVIFVNTPCGQQALDRIRDNIEMVELSIADCVSGNPMLVQPLPKPEKERTRYFTLLTQEGFEKASQYLSSYAPVKWKPSKRGVRNIFSLFSRERFKLFRIIALNGFSRVYKGVPLLIPYGRVLVEKRRSGKIRVTDGDVHIGKSLFKKSRLESRVLILQKALLEMSNCTISYGCDFELFKGAHLKIGTDVYMNIGATIICAKLITLGKGVILGRNVTIRDTHGGHFVNQTGYEPIAPVVIEDHVWLCEGCTIMPGVTVGTGAVVAAHALVTKDVPPNTIVAGIPAKVIRENVEWKR